jgi:Flp pilus assembly protein TadG
MYIASSMIARTQVMLRRSELWHIGHRVLRVCVEALATMKVMRSLWGNREGSALLEAAVFTPMLFSLSFGVMEFSFYFYQQQLIESGIRDAARYLARVPTTSGATPCTQTDPATGTSYMTYAQNIAIYGTTSASTQRVHGWTGPVTITCPTTDNSGGTYSDGTTIYTISATTSFADPALGFFGVLHLSAPSISVTHKERYIGPG